MKLKLVLAYKGTNYNGFASQVGENINTIQQQVEKAVFDITQKSVTIVCSGRTDAGVHAQHQVCLADIDTNIPIDKLQLAINAKLPKDIVIKYLEQTSDDFHPRFNVKTKTYRYQILNAGVRDPFLMDYTYFYPYKLDLVAMKEASTYIVGTHDFKCFCASKTGAKTTTRTVYDINLYTDEDIIKIDISGNGFLYNMVRIIVGTLIEVGRGKIPPSEVERIIQSKNRKNAGPTAPALGLMMLNVEYV
ncbi:MAG: tRNA pseudouridine(38-40) synthase TruA [Epulopiscium sp. Nuni2H_MBin003]|nr:MAG: tRNA pseudouridine(38-40) synthase TruA [Epulopiscium sp. Nuni2H_MBin003]